MWSLVIAALPSFINLGTSLLGGNDSPSAQAQAVATTGRIPISLAPVPPVKTDVTDIALIVILILTIVVVIGVFLNKK